MKKVIIEQKQETVDVSKVDFDKYSYGIKWNGRKFFMAQVLNGEYLLFSADKDDVRWPFQWSHRCLSSYLRQLIDSGCDVFEFNGYDNSLYLWLAE